MNSLLLIYVSGYLVAFIGYVIFETYDNAKYWDITIGNFLENVGEGILFGFFSWFVPIYFIGYHVGGVCRILGSLIAKKFKASKFQNIVLFKQSKPKE